MTSEPSGARPSPEDALTRRGFILGAVAGGAALGGAALVAYGNLRRAPARPDPLEPLGGEQGQRARVFVARAPAYDDGLVERIGEGLRELELGPVIARKRILLKPNLVETKPDNPHINTDPRFVLAVAEAFRRLDAAEVAVAEGQGHRRDSWLVLEESGYLEQLAEARLPFTDLNHDDLTVRHNLGSETGLKELVLPRRLEWADLLVTLPKLKTHHWVGCTLALKNMFGVLPGIYYGWPKNVLHHRGIENSILDINLTVRPGLAIVDGVIGMEGDGPINGAPKRAGVIVMGTQLAAVDATCARIMGLRLDRIGYLCRASLRGLGPIRAQHVRQLGASLAEVQQDFAVIARHAALKDPGPG